MFIKKIPKSSLIFIILGFLALGSFLAWFISASYLAISPFARFIHSCSKMLSTPNYFTVVGLIIFSVLFVWLTLMTTTAITQKNSLRKYLSRLIFSPEIPDKLREAINIGGITTPVYYALGNEDLAFAFGLIKPCIVISKNIVENLELEELTAVLLHEESHSIHKDPLRIYILRTLFPGLNKIKMIKLLINQFILAIEINADNYATSHLGEKSLSLAAALLKLVANEDNIPAYAAGAISALDSRIEHLVNPNWTPRFSLSLLEYACLALYLAATIIISVLAYRHFSVWFSCHTYSLF